MFDSPVSPRSPAREQVSFPHGGEVSALAWGQVGTHSCTQPRMQMLPLQIPGTPMSWGAACRSEEESTSLVPPHASQGICPSPQGLLSSDPDLELLLNKISTVNHLLSSLEKKVPAPRPTLPGWGAQVQGDARSLRTAAAAWLCPGLGNLALLQQSSHLN